jgi:hypothetical protein
MILFVRERCLALIGMEKTSIFVSIVETVNSWALLLRGFLPGLHPMVRFFASHRTFLSCRTSCLVDVVGWCLPHSMRVFGFFFSNFTSSKTRKTTIRLAAACAKLLSLFLPVILCKAFEPFSSCHLVQEASCSHRANSPLSLGWGVEQTFFKWPIKPQEKQKKGKFSYWTSNHSSGDDDLSFLSKIPLPRGLIKHNPSSLVSTDL